MVQRVTGKLGLDQNLSWYISTSGSPRNLHQLRKQAFRRAKIRAEQGNIRIQGAYQRQVGEIMTFGQNLSPDQYVHALSLDIFQHFLPGILSGRTITINTHDACIGKPMEQGSFNTLRAVAERGDILLATFGTVRRKALLVTTMMATQFLFAQVYDQTAGAAIAGCRPCA